MGGGEGGLLGSVEISLMQPSLVVVAGEIGREMGVRVHESGRERGISEIDHLRALRDGKVAAHIDDLVALNNNDAVCDERLRFSVEQASSFQDDRRRTRISGESANRRERQDRREKTKQFL